MMMPQGGMEVVRVSPPTFREAANVLMSEATPEGLQRPMATTTPRYFQGPSTGVVLYEPFRVNPVTEGSELEPRFVEVRDEVSEGWGNFASRDVRDKDKDMGPGFDWRRLDKDMRGKERGKKYGQERRERGSGRGGRKGRFEEKKRGGGGRGGGAADNKERVRTNGFRRKVGPNRIFTESRCGGVREEGVEKFWGGNKRRNVKQWEGGKEKRVQEDEFRKLGKRCGNCGDEHQGRCIVRGLWCTYPACLKPRGHDVSVCWELMKRCRNVDCEDQRGHRDPAHYNILPGSTNIIGWGEVGAGMLKGYFEMYKGHLTEEEWEVVQEYERKNKK